MQRIAGRLTNLVACIIKRRRRLGNEQIILSFVPLKEYNAAHLPVGMASGCLARYHGHMFLLTVFHAVGDLSTWSLELRYDSKIRRVKSLMLSGFNFLKGGNLNSTKLKDIDFAYLEIGDDVQPMYQQIEPNGNILVEKPRTIHITDFGIIPSAREEYCFAGLAEPLFKNNVGSAIPVIEQKLNIQKGLKYIETVDSGDVHVFKLPFPHPGHATYQGCSGSPIMDNEGNVVALVTDGDVHSNEIYGINLNKYKLCLDIAVGLIK